MCWVPDLEAGLLRNGQVIVKPITPAIWIEKEKLLLVSEECREESDRLSEAISHLIQREDLDLPIKVVLKEFKGFDPDQNKVIQVLGQLKLTEKHYQEAREHWRGDLGQIIRMIRPFVFMVKRDADIGAFVELETEEEVTAFLERLNEPMIESRSLLQMARRASDLAQFGFETYKCFGERAQLANWNLALASLGQPTLTNQRAIDEFKAHLSLSYHPLGCLIVSLVRRNPKIGLFKDLFDQLNSLACPESFENELWEVTFNGCRLDFTLRDPIYAALA